MSEFTVEQYTESISAALTEGDVKMAVSILHAMAVEHPRAAREVLDVIKFGLTVADGMTP